VNKKPPFLRRRLGRRLRTIREDANLTLDAAAARLDKTRSALARIETGQTKADVHFIRSAMDLYDFYDEDLLDQARAAAKPQWFRAYGIEDLGYVDVETYASAVDEFPGLNLPGLLQTEAYIRAMLERGRRRRTAEQLRNDIKVRLIRQKRLVSDENPLELTAIVDESALLRDVGGREVMRGQHRQLIEMAALPAVTLQVLPMEAHGSLDGGFIVLSFPDPEDADLLYVEYATGALHIEDEEEVRAARLVFDRLRTEALSPVDSVAMIEQISLRR
jgi:transcriptional regulator with XRE-family HTH domain